MYRVFALSVQSLPAFNIVTNDPVSVLRHPTHASASVKVHANTHQSAKVKDLEAKMGSDGQDQHAPPSYSSSGDSQPPTYNSLDQKLRANMSSLAVGDPSEKVSVPMISRTVANSVHNYNPFSRKSGAIKQSVTVRSMTRDFYLKHYAKDVDGNYIGTAAPAPDAALVFVPGKSTPEDVMRQVDEVAFKRQGIRGEGIGKFGLPIAGSTGSMDIGGSV
jgi:hypothetical protein